MKWCWGLLIMSGLPGLAGAVDADTSVEARLREAGRDWLARNGGVGLSIGVYDKGQRSYYNFGTTRIDGNTPPTQKTIYEIGPIAKTMAAQILARAIVEGRAAPGDEAAKYLQGPYPNLANSGEGIRLVHLANMTSQLLDNIPDITQVRRVAREPLSATQMRVFAEYSKPEFLRQLRRVVPRRAPGVEPGDSNVAAMVLGVVLEQIYDEPYETILAREIEKPLRMASGTRPDARLLARGYSIANEELPSFDARMAYTWGSLRYSTEDLLRYAAWQMVERDASVKLAHQPTWTVPGGRGSVAYYWVRSESSQGRRLYFAGGTWGFASCVDLYPDAQLALVLLSNRAPDDRQESLRTLAEQFVDMLRPEPISSARIEVPTAR